MGLPALNDDGYLPLGLHAAPLGEVRERFGSGSAARERQAELLRQAVEAAKEYPDLKRVLVWGSFVSAKPEPNDLDYSIVVTAAYNPAAIAEAHRRFFVPFTARLHYGVDRGYLVIHDYPLEGYVEQVDFICQARSEARRRHRGIIEISLRGEAVEERGRQHDPE